MKTSFLILTFILSLFVCKAQISKSVSYLTPGDLIYRLTQEELNNINTLSISGTMDARDFKTMRDRMPKLTVIDLSGVKIAQYVGMQGTSLLIGEPVQDQTYPANMVPDGAFYEGFFFNEHKNLTTVYLPGSITSIGESAFLQCDYLKDLPIPSKVTSINRQAFKYCSSLTSIAIPAAVTTIGEEAFAECTALKSFTAYSKTPASLQNVNAFNGIDKTTCILYVPEESVELYKAATGWKDFLKIEPIHPKLVVENKMWSIGEVGTMVGSTYQSYYVKFKGDTIINGKSYKKILKSFDEAHSIWKEDQLIQEDPATQRVFLYNKYNQHEQLLYDFNLEAGDSVFMNDEYFKVDKVVYAPYGSSSEIRKHIYFKHYGYFSLWVEGIGNVYVGVLEQLGFFTGADIALTCYFESDKLMYHNPRFNNCFPVGTWEENQQPEFAPIGAEWYYSYGESFMTPDVGYYVLKSSKDTIVDNKLCKVLTHKLVSSKGIASNDGQSIVYHDPYENKIYYYLNGSFNLLYDFTKQAGDTIIIKTPRSATTFQSIKLIVDSVGTVKFADKIQRKTLYVHTIENPGYIFSGKIIEGIGNENYFFPVYELYCDGGCPNPLRCYKDRTIDVRFSDLACDFIYTNAEVLEFSNISVYPNPFTGSFTIRNGNHDTRLLSIEIVNQLGQSIFCDTMNGNTEKRVDLGKHPSGIYYLLVKGEGKMNSYQLIKK